MIFLWFLNKQNALISWLGLLYVAMYLYNDTAEQKQKAVLYLPTF